MKTYLILFIIIVLVIAVRKIWLSGNWKKPTGPFPKEWRKILAVKVLFYNSLSQQEKEHFEYKVLEFILNIRITGIETDVDITDKLLVASSAIIPVFQFHDWKYINLKEVLLYPGMFNDNFETGSNGNILGMVGTGFMEGKMILSKPALHIGFENESDKKNTAIHEFVHLIDKLDGFVDGIPKVLMEKQYMLPWLDLMNKKIEEIYNDRSDINPYGGTNRAEFFAVSSEYFFEKPLLLKQKHPELYKSLEKIFRHKMILRNLQKKNYSIGRNSICPCGSGKKYKHCCGKY